MENKPYFKGQKTGAPCGHFYPDFMRRYDKLISDKIIGRVCYCFKCRKHFVIKKRMSSFHNPEELLFEKSLSLKSLRRLRKRTLIKFKQLEDKS